MELIKVVLSAILLLGTGMVALAFGVIVGNIICKIIDNFKGE